MKTDPNLITDQPQPELALEPIDAVEVMPEEEQPPLPQEEVQVAGMFKGGLVGQAKQLAEELDTTPQPTTPPIAKVEEGQLILTPVPDDVAQRMRETLHLPEDSSIDLPNLTRTNPDGTTSNVMNMSDGAVNYIKSLHKAFDEKIDHAKRGSMTLEAIAKRAKSLGMNEAIIELLDRNVAQALNPEQMYRAIWVRSAMAEEVSRIMREGSDEDVLRILPLAASVEIQTAGAVGEGGRAMAVLSHAGKLHITDAAMKKMPELMELYQIDDLTIENVRAAYNALRESDPESGMARAMTFIRTMGTKGMNAWAEGFMNALLSGLPTHAVNILGNAIFGAIQIPERAVAGAVGAVRTNIFRGLGGKDRVYMSESYEMLASLADGIPTGLRAAWKALRYEEGTFGGPMASKVDARVERAIGSEYWGANPEGLVGRFLDFTGVMTRFLGSRMLLVEDEFAKGVTFHMELRAKARRTMLRQLEEGMDEEKVLKNGARILAGQDVDAIKSAEDFAVRTTFQNDLGPIASWMNKGFSHPLMKIWVPFFRTPTNIIKETLQRSPLAMMPGTGFWTELKQGGAVADQAMSKFIFGSGLFATVASMATGEMIDGFKITGAGPKDKNAAAAWKRNGWDPYSFVVRQPDGTWKNYNYGRLAPVAGIFAMASDYAYYSQYADSESELEQLFLRAGAGMYNVISELPMMQGIFSVTELTGSEYENFDQKFDRAYQLLVKQATGAAITAVPYLPTGSLTASVERTMNPIASDVKPTTEQTQNEIQTSNMAKGFYEAINRAKSRNPFFADDLPKKLNLWGEEMQQCENGGWCFISPIRVRATKGNIVDQEMVKLGLGIRMPSRTQRGVKLTSDQYQTMISRINEMTSEDGRGVSMLEEMEEQIDTDEYDRAEIGGTGGKLEQLKSILTSRKKRALDEMFEDTATGLQDKKDTLDDHFESTGRKLAQ